MISSTSIGIAVFLENVGRCGPLRPDGRKESVVGDGAQTFLYVVGQGVEVTFAERIDERTFGARIPRFRWAAVPFGQVLVEVAGFPNVDVTDRARLNQPQPGLGVGVFTRRPDGCSLMPVLVMRDCVGAPIGGAVSRRHRFFRFDRTRGVASGASRMPRSTTS
jgi:hypothetical protein